MLSFVFLRKLNTFLKSGKASTSKGTLSVHTVYWMVKKDRGVFPATGLVLERITLVTVLNAARLVKECTELMLTLSFHRQVC